MALRVAPKCSLDKPIGMWIDIGFRRAITVRNLSISHGRRAIIKRGARSARHLCFVPFAGRPSSDENPSVRRVVRRAARSSTEGREYFFVGRVRAGRQTGTRFAADDVNAASRPPDARKGRTKGRTRIPRGPTPICVRDSTGARTSTTDACELRVRRARFVYKRRT